MLQAAERHAIKRQRREAGLDNTYTRDGIEEVRHEEESFFTAKSGGAFQVRRRRQHKTKKNKNNTGERWCHDGYKELKGRLAVDFCL